MSDKHKKYIVLSLYAVGVIVLSGGILSLLLDIQKLRGILCYGYRVLSPLIIGYAIAYLLDPVVRFVETKVLRAGRKGGGVFRRALSVTAVYAVLISLACLLFTFVFPEFLQSIQSLIDNFDSYKRELEAWTVSLAGENSYAAGIFGKLPDLLEELYAAVERFLFSSSSKTAEFLTRMWDAVINGFIGIVVSVYMLLDRDRLVNQSKRLTAAVFRRHTERVFRIGRLLNRSMGGFIRGTIIDSLLIGGLCFLFMLIFRLHYALMISVIIAITNVIPFLGPFIGGIPCFLILLMVDTGEALIFGVMILLLQLVEGYVIKPKIIGSSIGLSSFWILASVMIMGGFFGVPGMILGVPLFYVLYVGIGKYVNKNCNF